MIIAPIAVLALAAASAQPADTTAPQPAVMVLEGPTLVCGEAFALNLNRGERARYEEGPDFQVFSVEAADGPFVIYEGNFPQDGAELIRTGRAFPTFVALHYRPGIDARSQRRTRARIVTGRRMTRLCSHRAGAGQ